MSAPLFDRFDDEAAGGNHEDYLLAASNALKRAEKDISESWNELAWRVIAVVVAMLVYKFTPNSLPLDFPTDFAELYLYFKIGLVLFTGLSAIGIAAAICQVQWKYEDREKIRKEYSRLYKENLKYLSWSAYGEEG